MSIPTPTPQELSEEVIRHVLEESLERFVLGNCTEEELADIECHLLCCDRCLDRVQQVELYVLTIKMALEVVEVCRFPRSGRRLASAHESFSTREGQRSPALA